jgi:hypothetical protein
VGINPGVGDIAAKAVAIPHTIRKDESGNALWDEPAAHQVVGKVMAYQAFDGSLVWEDDQADWDWDTAQTPTGGSSKGFSPMAARLREQRRVQDDGLRVVNCF